MVPMNPPGVHAPAGTSGQAPNDVIAYYSSYAITESSNCTQVLAGARVANAVTLEYNSRPTLAFVFNVRLRPPVFHCVLTSFACATGSRGPARRFIHSSLPRFQHLREDDGHVLDTGPRRLLRRRVQDMVVEGLPWPRPFNDPH